MKTCIFDHLEGPKWPKSRKIEKSRFFLNFFRDFYTQTRSPISTNVGKKCIKTKMLEQKYKKKFVFKKNSKKFFLGQFWPKI